VRADLAFPLPTQLIGNTRSVSSHSSTSPLTLARICRPACVCFRLIVLTRAPVVWLSSSAPCHAKQRRGDLQVPPLHALFNNESFVVVNRHGQQCKGFLMRDPMPNGQTLSYCWVFVPPTQGTQYSIHFIPCYVTSSRRLLVCRCPTSQHCPS
jgi:hypothetical protein